MSAPDWSFMSAPDWSFVSTPDWQSLIIHVNLSDNYYLAIISTGSFLLEKIKVIEREREWSQEFAEIQQSSTFVFVFVLEKQTSLYI